MRLILKLSALALVPGLLQAENNPAFRAEFDQGSPWKLFGVEDTLIPLGDAKVVDSAMILGQTGLAILKDYKQPRGAFTVEARFFLNQYGASDAHWIADIVNTATWSSTYTQGFSMRVGGGNLYPVLPSTAYDDENGYGASSRYFDHNASASISRCLAEFTIGTGGTYWKEVYSDVCVETGRWVHMVSVYDGIGMHLFLDGVDATDRWRVQGMKSTANLDSIQQLHIGARTTDYFDIRHTSGKIDFVRIHDSAMSPRSIRASYIANAPEGPEVRCGRRPVIVTPQSGKWSDGRSRILVRLMPTPGCVDTAPKAWKKGDRIHIRIRRGHEDSTPLVVEMKDSIATFDSLLDENQKLPEGEVLVSAAIDSTSENAVAGRAMSAATLSFGASRPLVVGASVGVRRSNPSGSAAFRWNAGELLVSGEHKPAVLGLDGRTLRWSSRRTETGWALAPRASDKGVFLVRTSGQSATILIP